MLGGILKLKLIALLPLRKFPNLLTQISNNSRCFLLLFGRGFTFFKRINYFLNLRYHSTILSLPARRRVMVPNQRLPL